MPSKEKPTAEGATDEAASDGGLRASLSSVFRVTGGKAQQVTDPRDQRSMSSANKPAAAGGEPDADGADSAAPAAAPASSSASGSSFFSNMAKNLSPPGGGRGGKPSSGEGDGEGGYDAEEMTTDEQLAAMEQGNCCTKMNDCCSRLGKGNQKYAKLAGDAASTKEDPLAPSAMAIKIFPLLYSRGVGWRQLFFSISFVIPVLVGFAVVLMALLTPPTSERFVLDSGSSNVTELVLDVDYCSVVFESDPKLSAGQVAITAQFGAGRSMWGDDDTFFSFCPQSAAASALLPVGQADPKYCRRREAPTGESIGFSLGCSNRTEWTGAAHLCAMNIADKTFIDAAYSDWNCKISVAVAEGGKFPPIVVRSTEPVMYDGLKRVSVLDAESDVLERFDDPATLEVDESYRNNRYSNCSRRLNFSTLQVSSPSAHVQLDCFTSDGITLNDMDASHFSLFADTPGALGTTVDVNLKRGDFYLWTNERVQVQYNSSSALGPPLSSLCLAGDQVLKCSSNTSESYALSPSASDVPDCHANYAALHVNVNNDVTRAVEVRGELQGDNATHTFNHVQIEVGGFDDHLFAASGTSLTRDGAQRPKMMESMINGYANVSKTLSISQIDKDWLQALFHHDGAKQPNNIQRVELHVTGEGLPLGNFVWYSNPIYAFVSPWVLSFISLNLLTPVSLDVELELVDSFCPLVHHVKPAATLAVLKEMYSTLYEAVAPVPTHSVVGFQHVGSVYPGLARRSPGGTPVLDDYIFARDQSSPDGFLVLTKQQAIDQNTIFKLLIVLNVTLTVISALLFSFFALRVVNLLRRKAIFELVAGYRHDLCGSVYAQLEQAHKQAEMQENAETKRIPYLVTVRTGKARAGGTVGRVFLTMCGKTDETREIELVDDQGRNLFNSGEAATFSVHGADVGMLTKIRVRHEPDLMAWSNPNWLLDSISVQAPRYIPSNEPPYLDKPETAHFVCNRWFCNVYDSDDSEDESSHTDLGLVQEIDAASDLGKQRNKATGLVKRKRKKKKKRAKESVMPLGKGRSTPKPSSPGAEDESKQADAGPMGSSGTEGNGEDAADSDDSDDDGIEEDIALEPERRELLDWDATKIFEPRCSPFWILDVMACVQRRRAFVKRLGTFEMDPRTADETCRLFRHKLMNKYLAKWKGKVDDAYRDIMQQYPGLKSTLQLDENGSRIVDPETGRAKGETIIRQGVLKGYRARKTLISDMDANQKRALRMEKDIEMEQNFQVFDVDGDGTLNASMVQVAMKARGIVMSVAEAAEVIADLDSTGDPLTMNVAEYKELVRLKGREMPENFEDLLAFKYFADPKTKTINFKQLKRVCKELGSEMSDREVVEMVDRADLGGEGVITLDEFCTVLGMPMDADAVRQKIKALPIPALPDGSTAWGQVRRQGRFKVLSHNKAEDEPDRVMFERIVARYWRRYREMTDVEQQAFLKQAALASVPGCYMDSLPSTVQLSLMGLTKTAARALLKHARTQMRLESFQSWFELNPAEQKRMCKLVIERCEEYFEMGITKRRWFFKQSLSDRILYLNRKATQKLWDARINHFFQLCFEAMVSFLHVCTTIVPTIPLFLAGVLYDRTYKRFNPETNLNAYGPVITTTIVINVTFIAAALVYLFVIDALKGRRARRPREGYAEKWVRRLYYLCLFVTLFCAVVVIVCCLYWVILGAVLYPEKVVPILSSVLVFVAHIGTFVMLLQKFRRAMLNSSDGFIDKAEDLKKKVQTYKVRISRAKADLVSRAATAPPQEARKLEAQASKMAGVEDKARDAIAECGRMLTTSQQSIVDNGLTRLDLAIAVSGSALLVILLFLFIYMGLATFTTPGPESASVGTGLYLMVGKMVNKISSAGLSDESLDRMLLVLGQACEAVYSKADSAFVEVVEGGDELLADFEGDDE